jgi:uncharacterized protein (DUF1499 family)
MSWLDGLTRNWADLDADATDPDLRPVSIPLPCREAVSWAASVIQRLPRWNVVAADPDCGRLHATHATAVWRFIDDVHLEFRSNPGGSTVVRGRSQSRIGKGDLGQNRRNLRMLTQALRDAARDLPRDRADPSA